jgi:hypothetical protein
MKYTATLILAGLVLSACGSDSSDRTSTTTPAPAASQPAAKPSALNQIKATERAYLKAVQNDQIGTMCRLTADHTACLENVATLRALGIKPSDTLKGGEERVIDTMTVTITGNRARTKRGHELVRRNGRWLMVQPRS